MSRQDGRPAVRVPSGGALPAVTTRVEIHAGPFRRMRDVLAFIERMSGVRGMRDVRLERWVAGHVVLVVRHHDRVPLIATLRELEDPSLTVSTRQPHGIQITLRPGPERSDRFRTER